jgi:exopolysaccharide biosynthesis polyprenyl glycosylphosphotransferase
MMLRRLRAKGYNLKTAVIVGAGSLGRRVAKEIAGIPWAGIRVEGFFDDEEHGEDRSGLRKPLLGGIRDLRRYLQAHKVDYVILALPLRREKSIRWILSECRTLGAQLLLIPNIYDFSIFNAKITSLGGLLALDFNPDSRAKRTFDVAFSLLVLLGTLPLTLLIALLIKLQDGGPVFYRHRRITMAGKYFDCLKFRTMYVDADRKLAEILANDPQAREEWEKTFKLKNDPRVTWIGKFLRKTSLDELPQFLNVLKGDMSVVGARPIVEKELSEYYKENGGLYCSLKPGITGPWQVGKRSDTEDYSERVELDTWYVLNRTFWLDLKLICKTVFCVFTGRGAY